MDKKQIKRKLLRIGSYVLVAALSSAATWFLAPEMTKLGQLASLIDSRFIGEADVTALEDAAANAMVQSLGDRWSYYIPAEEYAAHLESEQNEYVGVGITVSRREDGTGYEIIQVTQDGPAQQAGILPGDIVTHADGQFLGELDSTQMRAIIMGKVNTQVKLTVLRDGQTMELSVNRKTIHTPAATGRMLTDTVGLVTIENFHKESARESIAAIEALLEQGAQSLVLDVRNNPGGFTSELVELLDYLLPEGPLFRTVNYNGTEKLDESDSKCLELPMAVLINGNSYSAAEFFAAALSEYDWAVTVGEKTVGKGYYQVTTPLIDGSAVNLSMGKYYTPQGVNLAEAGGLEPDIPVEPAQSYVTPEEDPQVQAALAALEGKS